MDKHSRNYQIPRGKNKNMYVTRPLSMYRRDPSALSLPPPEGPNSGILVIQDEAAETTTCFGMCKSHRVKDLPFPQNKNLRVQYTTTTSSGQGTQQHVETNRVVFIPVLNEPLSSNRYYVIDRRGKHKGKAYTNSREEDMTTCCFCKCVKDLKPGLLGSHDIYQQFEIQRRKWGGYVAKSIAPDGFPPYFLRRKDWVVMTSTPDDFVLSEAMGIVPNLRTRLPDFNFSISQQNSASVVVGRWYTPFMFIKEGMALNDQISRSRYYEVTLEQRWELIFSSDNHYNKGNSVSMDIDVMSEVVEFNGKEAIVDKKNVVDGVMWFRSFDRMGRELSIGLSLAVVERMKWEQERAGWMSGGEREVKMKRTKHWIEFGCCGEDEMGTRKSRMDEWGYEGSEDEESGRVWRWW